jgi:hypothetical protein
MVLMLSTAASAQNVVTMPKDLRLIPMNLKAACLPSNQLDEMATAQGFEPLFTGKLDTIEKPIQIIDDVDAALTVYFNPERKDLATVIRYDKLGYSCVTAGATDVRGYGDDGAKK